MKHQSIKLTALATLTASTTTATNAADWKECDLIWTRYIDGVLDKPGEVLRVPILMSGNKVMSNLNSGEPTIMTLGEDHTSQAGDDIVITSLSI